MMDEDIAFVAEDYASRFHQTAAPTLSIPGDLLVNVERIKAVGAVVTVGAVLKRLDLASAMTTGENLIAGDKIFTLVHEVD